MLEKIALLSLLALGASAGANASAIINGTDMIKADHLGQLETLIGQGDLDLTNIFTKDATDNLYDDSQDWHRDVDGQGATVTVMEFISNLDGSKTIVAGYNEFSWASAGSFTNSSNLNNFLVNLTTGDTFLKNTSSARQVMGWRAYGATFGNSYDLLVNGDLTTGGNNIGKAYGDTAQYGLTSYRESLTGLGGQSDWTIGYYETFTIDTALASLDGTGFAKVDDVSAPAMFSVLGLMALGLTRRRKK